MQAGLRSVAGMLVVLGLAALPASAAEVRRGQTVDVAPNETITDDFYVTGGTLQMRGRVDGDLVIAGGNVTVDGPVTGDLLAAGGKVIVNGDVGGSVRVGSGNVTLGGKVGRDAAVGAGKLRMTDKSSVGRDLLVGSGDAVIAGPIARNVLASTGTLVLSNTVGGDVRGQVAQLKLTDGARIAGNLDYTGNEQPQIAPGARVDGRTTFSPSAASQRGPWPFFLGWLRAVIGFAAFGLLFAWLMPTFARRTAGELVRTPGSSIGWGLVVALVGPLVAGTIVALGTLVGGWWIGLIAFIVLVIAVLLGLVSTAFALGRQIADRSGRRTMRSGWAMVLGVVVLALIGLVPFLGALVLFVAMLAGLGALVLAAARTRRTGGESLGTPARTPPATPPPVFRPPIPQT